MYIEASFRPMLAVWFGPICWANHMPMIKKDIGPALATIIGPTQLHMSIEAPIGPMLIVWLGPICWANHMPMSERHRASIGSQHWAIITVYVGQTLAQHNMSSVMYSRKAPIFTSVLKSDL